MGKKSWIASSPSLLAMTLNKKISRIACGDPGVCQSVIASDCRILVEHDLFGKPVATFPDHALKRDRVGNRGTLFCFT
jgi:hypothetical protein